MFDHGFDKKTKLSRQKAAILRAYTACCLVAFEDGKRGAESGHCFDGGMMFDPETIDNPYTWGYESQTITENQPQ